MWHFFAIFSILYIIETTKTVTMNIPGYNVSGMMVLIGLNIYISFWCIVGIYGKSLMSAASKRDDQSYPLEYNESHQNICF